MGNRASRNQKGRECGKKAARIFVLVFIFCLGPSFSSLAQSKVIQLPSPLMEGGKPLLQCLKQRQSTRDYDPGKKLPLQVLSNLLWAADGVNRSDGKRTAPSAGDWQNIEIYLLTADGVLLYDAPQHILKVLGSADMRASSGKQSFIKDVSLNLLFVADFARAKKLGGNDAAMNAENWSFAGAGAIAQNVYLFCASEGLGSIVRAMTDQDAAAKTLKLRPDQHVILAQSGGYPKSR
jgi:nitroreductase